MEITVAALKIGQKGIIKEIMLDDLPLKLIELGCLPGNEVTLLHVAPLKDPIYIDVNGSHIAIRKSTARKIAITVTEEENV